MISFNFLPMEGGQGRHFYELAERFQGHRDFELLAFSPHILPSTHHRSAFTAVQRLPLGQLIFSLLLPTRIKRMVQKEELDILLLNGGPGGVFLSSSPGVATVYCANHTYLRQSRQVAGEKWKALLIPFERRSYHLADKVVSISNVTRRDLTDYYDLPVEDISVVPVGIDTDVFRPLSLERTPLSIFFLGRLDRRKGLGFLLRALPLVRAQIPHVRLFVGGSGRHLQRFKDLVRESGLSPNVEFLGSLRDQDLPLWYNRCSVQVVPSIFEGLGIAALEGLACGTLLVATRGSGIEDIVTHERNGFLVEYGDRQELADALVRLLSKPDHYDRIRENAKTTVAEGFAWPRVLPLWERVFLDLPRSGPPEAP